MSAVGFHVEHFATAVGRRGALVVTPKVHVRVGADRIAELRHEHAPSPIDELILQRALASRGQIQACVFRAASDDGSGSYGMEAGMEPATARELARELLRAQLRVYRRLVGVGVCSFIHVEFRGEELDAYREASEQLVAECEETGRSPGSGATVRQRARLDSWLLRNLVFYFHIDRAALMARVLPEKLPLLEKRMTRALELVARLNELEAQAAPEPRPLEP